MPRPALPRHPAPALLLAALTPLVSLIAAPPALAQRATLERIVHQETLDNGLQVIVLENHAVPLATAEIVVRAGAITQEPDDQGVPHLFEHMLFKSYVAPGGGNFGQAAARLLAGYNGVTDDEEVAYYLTLPSSRLEAGVHLLADLLRGARFSGDALQTERQVVYGEVERHLSDPRFRLHHELERRLWGPAFHRKNTMGEVETLQRVTTRRLDSIYRRLYVPNNAALVVTGDVVPAAVFEMARRRFGGWKAGADPFATHPVPPIPGLDTTRVVVVSGDKVSDVTLEMQWQGPSVRGDPAGTYAADVLSDVVDDDDSRFHARLVDSGLFSSVHLSYGSRDHVGPITLVATTTMPKLAEALTALSTELQAMTAPGYFSPEELAVATKRRAVRTALTLEQGAGFAHTVGTWWAVSGLDYYLGYVDNMSARTPSDLNACVARYLAGRRFVVGALVPEKDASQVSAWLEQYVGFVEGR